MPAIANRGPLSKAIRNLCRELDQGVITKEQFQAKLARLINRYGYLGGIVYQDVGLALDHWIRVRHRDKTAQYWQLADQTEVRIRQAFEHWKHTMLK